MESSWYIYTIIIIILIFLSSFFSSAETAITSLNLIRIKSIAKLRKSKKSKRAKIVFKLVKNYNSTLTTILIGNTLVNLLIGTLSTILFVTSLQLGTIAPIISTLVSTFFVLIIGEIIPKSFAKIYPEKVALYYAYILYFLNFVFYPLTMIFKLFELKSKHPTSSEQELIELVATIEDEGVLEKAERDLIESAIIFDEKSIIQSMKAKTEVYFIYDTVKPNEIKDLYLKQKYSRIPVLDSTTEQVMGILNIKDYITKMLINEQPDIKSLVSEPLYLSKRTKLNTALEMLQTERTHIAIVSTNKESEDFLGIVTLEDILEELVGEIYDESDAIGLVQEVGKHKFLVNGHVNLELFFKDYLKDKAPKIATETTLEQWYKKRIKRPHIRKNSPDLKYKNYLFMVDQSSTKNAPYFKVEVLTKKPKKQDWE